MIPNGLAVRLQNTIRDLARDDWTFARLIFWRKDFAENPYSDVSMRGWQFCIVFIYRLFKADLIKVISYDHYADNEVILDDLRRYNPYERTGRFRPGDYAWNGIFVCGTDNLAAMVRLFPE